MLWLLPLAGMALTLVVVAVIAVTAARVKKRRRRRHPRARQHQLPKALCRQSLGQLVFGMVLSCCGVGEGGGRRPPGTDALAAGRQELGAPAGM
jgi:hypothetical protein